MSKASALRATSLPMRPKPTMPIFLPLSRMMRMPRPSLPQATRFVALSNSTMRRFHASSSANTWSDTSSTQ